MRFAKKRMICGFKDWQVERSVRGSLNLPPAMGIFDCQLELFGHQICEDGLGGLGLRVKGSRMAMRGKKPLNINLTIQLACWLSV